MARILIIDDEDQTRRALRQKLERAGYEVVEARNGCEGVERYRAHAIDLVITDIIMPDQEGLETIQELKRACPAVKIVAMSGGGRTGTLNFLSIAEKLGAQHTLHKPFKLQDMLDVVNGLLEQ